MKLKKINKSVLSKLEDEYKKEIGFYSWTGENATEMNIFASNTNLTHNNQLKYNCDDKGDPLIYDPKSEKKIKLEIRLSFKISDYGKKNKHMKDKWDEINEENIYVISKNIYKRNIERSYELIKEFCGTEEELKKSMFKQSVIILDHFKEYLPATICINDKCPKIGKKRRILYLHDVNKKKNEEIWKCKKCEEERIFRIPTESIKETAKVCTYCGRGGN